MTSASADSSFIESLSAKVHSTPPNIEKLSQLFQDFYALASSHVNTHINALALKANRETSPSPSTSSMSSAASRFRSKAASLGAKDKPKADVERQMITSEELANKRKARKALESKKGLLEEAVERRLCEAIYERIYRHRSTQDEAQDDKLRSKTAALSLINIGLSDLGVDLGQGAKTEEKDKVVDEEDIRESLEPARKELKDMSESHYPLGKINYLKAVHKSIVDTLAHYQPSASADEIMPMLIYTLITLPPESLHVISDLHFMQNFRWEPKLTGEAAYCLTNLEAAISFLQTVDLSTLREDELPSGPPKVTTPGESSKQETFPPAYPQGVSTTAQSTSEASTESATATKPAASPGGLKAASVLRNRGLSDLVNTPAQAFSTASDAVFSTADQGLKTISSSLGDSYSFLLGKLRERQAGPKESIVVPRTLDDARKLISTPPPEDDDNTSIAEAQDEEASTTKPATASHREDRVLSLIGGRREHSADSTRSARSGSSAKKVGFTEDQTKAGPGVASTATQQGAAMLDSVRSLGSTFNPMSRLPSIGTFRGFGRSGGTPAVATPPPSAAAKEGGKSEDGGDLSTVRYICIAP